MTSSRPTFDSEHKSTRLCCQPVNKGSKKSKFSRIIIDLRVHVNHRRAERQNQWVLFTFEQRAHFYWPAKKKILLTQWTTGGIFFLCFSLCHKWSSWTFNVSLWPLYLCAAIVLKYNFITPAWFYCSAYLHDRADREKHYVLLWSVDVVTVFLNSYLVWQKLLSDICQFSSMQTLPARVGQPAEQPAQTGCACSSTLTHSHRTTDWKSSSPGLWLCRWKSW